MYIADYLPRQAGETARPAYKNQGVVVYISTYKIYLIKDLAEKIAARKQAEYIHQVDWYKTVDRWVTGMMGEAALEKLLGLQIIEWEAGDSKKYNHADIKEYGTGIKTVEQGKHHVIAKRNFFPQILCTVLDEHRVRVDGLATVDMLNTYQDDSFILDPRLRARGVKTCFTGYDELIRISNKYDLEESLKHFS